MNPHHQAYREKCISPPQVADLIQSDSDIIVAQCASEPGGCMAQFHLAAPRVNNVKVFSVLALQAYEFYRNPSMQGHFELCSWFHSHGARGAMVENTGTVTYVPNMAHRAAADRIGVRRPHLFVGTCTPPDENGFVSLSLGITYEKDVLEAAEIVVLEVNEQLPRTAGDTHVHMRDVDFFVEHHRAPPTLPSAEPTEVERTIGMYIAELVEDGATIQLGIGGIPNAVASALKHKRDLGVHTEMLVDSMLDLYQAGAITNKAKTLLKDKFVCTFAMGSERLYQFMHNNPAIEIRRGCWVNDPAVIRQNAKMVSINTCLMVDLTGQVASESLGPMQYSGTGGQTDTAVGATGGLDGKGKSIIACRSTAKNGTVSTIVPMLPEGAAVTLHRANTDLVVTEWGVARLRGRTVRERATALIAVAHPDHRSELKMVARTLGYL